MYKIDKQTNRISRLSVQSFSELGFSERNHLQEWLANEPEALGEELLIIQKEFDGFDDTRERLDLLALDKEGSLVVIENKLDDSGRDVVWQALKYCSYCSSLSKVQIVEIYQQYLNRYCGGGDARALVCEFLEVPELDEVILNSGNGQRLMFVAAKFRKEVTSTALWLLGYGIQLQCFKVTPYADGNELFLNVEQIIPTPEAQELMIGISAKNAEEASTQVELKNRHKIRMEFWEQALERLRKSPCDLFNGVSASKEHWLYGGSGVGLCPFTLIFGAKEARVELTLSRREAVENKRMFDHLFAMKEEIEASFGAELQWLRQDSSKLCRIVYGKEFDGYNRDNWPEITEWMTEYIQKLEIALKAPLLEVAAQLKSA